MKKQTKSSLTRKLDQECSRVVRGRGVCAKCGSIEYEKFQCAHIFSRVYRSVRWFLDNLLCLCASCHFWAHRNPVLFTEFVKQYLGEERYQFLKSTATAIKRWNIVEMSELLSTLKQL